MNTDSLRASLAGRHLGHLIEVHQTLTSTNERAAELARAGAGEGVVVIAESQTAGRGRLGRQWTDLPGQSLLFSLILDQTLPRDRWPLLSLAVGAACARALTAATGAAVRTKWPNDLVVLPKMSQSRGNRGLQVSSADHDSREIRGLGPEAPVGGAVAPQCRGKAPAQLVQFTVRPLKLGGILVEGTENRLIVGIGVNVLAAPDISVAPSGLAPTCLAAHCPGPLSREDLLVAMLGGIETLWEALHTPRGAEVVVAACRELDITLGMAVTLTTGQERISGTVQDIDAGGALVIETADGPRRFLAGDVTLSHTMTPSEADNP